MGIKNALPSPRIHVRDSDCHFFFFPVCICGKLEKISVHLLSDLKDQFFQALTREAKPKASLPAPVSTVRVSLPRWEYFKPVTQHQHHRQIHIQQIFIVTYCTPGIVLGTFHSWSRRNLMHCTYNTPILEIETSALHVGVSGLSKAVVNLIELPHQLNPHLSSTANCP